MSQITRCPACATTFKVVADQLRISEGWVRCGQCKEVFDASAHLLAPAAPPLLPDVSMADVRPPPAPVVRKAVEKAWGAGAAPPAMPGPGSRVARSGASPSPSSALERGAETVAADSVPAATTGVSGEGAAPMSGQGRPPPGGDSAGTLALGVPGPADAVSPMAVPEPTVPAFLSTSVALSGKTDLSLEPVTPFRWRTDGQGQSNDRPNADSRTPSSLARPTPGQGERKPVVEPWSTHGGAGADAGSSAYPPLELPIRPGTRRADAAPANADPASPHPDADVPEPDLEDLPGKAGSESPADSRHAAPARGAHLATTTDAPLTAEGAPEKVSQGSQPLQKDRDDEGEDEDEEEALPEPEPEVSFVVAARRKAFWRRPLVRTLLVLLSLVLLGGLAAQVAVQERDRIAATEPRLRPWLVLLCEPIGCELAPRRQIADVVIDSSSFNKARGDSYLLNLTLKNQASIPLAMPAMELTLTDAQDQPVLRRILLPNDMGAPAEMPARGEWGTSVSVVVTTGGARVAGYRLLAFYP